jgi:hypothetical protein
MQNKKTNAAAAARLAAEQAQEKIDEMATTSKYQVDVALQKKARRAARPVAKPVLTSRPAKNG